MQLHRLHGEVDADQFTNLQLKSRSLTEPVITFSVQWFSSHKRYIHRQIHRWDSETKGRTVKHTFKCFSLRSSLLSHARTKFWFLLADWQCQNLTWWHDYLATWLPLCPPTLAATTSWWSSSAQTTLWAVVVSGLSSLQVRTICWTVEELLVIGFRSSVYSTRYLRMNCPRVRTLFTVSVTELF